MKEKFFIEHKKQAEVIVMNMDTALMAFEAEDGGSSVCFDITGKDELCGMKLILSRKLKNKEIVVGGLELIQRYDDELT